MPSWPRDPDRFAPRKGCDGQLVIFLNGILTRPGDQWAWTDRAEDWFWRNTDQHVDSYEYFQTPILGRLWGERRNVREALELIRGYVARGAGERKAETGDRKEQKAEARAEGAFSPISGLRSPLSWRVHLVGHSRGCEVARRLIVEHGLQVESLHLFAAAIDADFSRNGLNQAMSDGRLTRTRVYVSRGDGVLRWIAGASLGLYGRLGYTGPRRVANPERVRVEIREQLSHGAWFAPEHFGNSMRAIAWDLDEVPM